MLLNPQNTTAEVTNPAYARPKCLAAMLFGLESSPHANTKLQTETENALASRRTAAARPLQKSFFATGASFDVNHRRSPNYKRMITEAQTR